MKKRTYKRRSEQVWGEVRRDYLAGMPAEDADLSALLDTLVHAIPAPIGDPEQPLQALVTNLDAAAFVVFQSIRA